MLLEKIRMNADSAAGMTSGKVILRRISILEAPSISPISSISELIELSAPEIRI